MKGSRVRKSIGGIPRSGPFFRALLLAIGLLPFCPLQAQNVYRFPVTETGVIAIPGAQLRSLGFQPETVRIMGRGGMLPQRLDSGQHFTLSESPSLWEADTLFALVEGPHLWQSSPMGELRYQHHLYSDTLYYELRAGLPLHRLTLERGEDVAPASTEAVASSSEIPRFWLHLQTVKEERFNLLSSGRNWYSDAVFSGNRYTWSRQDQPAASPAATRRYLLQARWMGAAFSPLNVEISSDVGPVGSGQIPAIVSSPFGVQGREQVDNWEFSAAAAPSEIRLQPQSSHANAALYVDHLGLFQEVALQAGLEGLLFPKDVRNPLRGNLAMGQRLWIQDSTGRWQVFSKHFTVSAMQKAFLQVSGRAQLLPEGRRLPAAPDVLQGRPALIIVTAPRFRAAAERLAQFRRSQGLQVQVISPQEVYEALHAGTRDITALRNYLAHHFQAGHLRHVLFFGKGTFDYKGRLGGFPNTVPTYTSRNSLEPLATYSSDDFFALLAPGQGEWTEGAAATPEMLQIGVGRLPVVTQAEADAVVEKLIAYSSSAPEGAWRKQLAFLVDDGDNNIHLQDAEQHSRFLGEQFPGFVQEKIYLDRFPLERRAGGRARSPEAQRALLARWEAGMLLLNFIGHGNESTLTEEEVFSVNDLPRLPAGAPLPIVVTATCAFGRMDSPFLRSGAERLLTLPERGAVALLSTGRPVFSSVNFTLNEAFMRSAFSRDEGGRPQELGEIYKATKNLSHSGVLNRNFSLIGDPSMRIGLPEYAVLVEELTDPGGAALDTLRAFQRFHLQGSVVDPLTGATLSLRGGEVEVSLFDKPSTLRTLGQTSSVTSFSDDQNRLFRISSPLVDGRWKASGMMPQQMDYRDGAGRFRLFAQLEEGSTAWGATRPTVGGSLAPPEDREPPHIRLEILADADENGRYGLGQLPYRLHFRDSSGINSSPVQLGQDLLLQLHEGEPEVLNARFRSIGGDMRRGELQGNLLGLVEGENRIRVEAWDIVGNKGVLDTSIFVQDIRQFRILAQRLYPNPGAGRRQMDLQHNRPGENLVGTFRVFSLTGQILLEKQLRYPLAEAQLQGIPLNFLDEKGRINAKGTYIYKIELRSEKDGTSDQRSGKLIIE
ncbi:MAG: type IX secretion system sortase PorU [Nitritalea sp.]